MIFTTRQLQVECVDHALNLYRCFVEPSKAFDTVNRLAFGEILEKFLNILKSFYADKNVRIHFRGKLWSLSCGQARRSRYPVFFDICITSNVSDSIQRFVMQHFYQVKIPPVDYSILIVDAQTKMHYSLIFLQMTQVWSAISRMTCKP